MYCTRNYSNQLFEYLWHADIIHKSLNYDFILFSWICKWLSAAASVNSRELRRLVYIPFIGSSVMGTTAEEVAAHVAIKRRIHKGDFSSAIGTFIQLGSIFQNNGMEEIGETYIPWVASHLDGCLADCILPYSIALWFAEKVINITINF